MTLKVIRSSDYLTDLLSVWGFHAKHSEVSADRMVAEIEDKVAMLSGFPDLGERCPQFHADCRRMLAGPYVIYYRRLDDHVRVLRVFHGAQRIGRLA